MQSSVNRKKSLDSFNQVLHSLHFAVCPYAIDLCSKMDSIFTLNFQKDKRIVGELSTMIYPEIDNPHIELDPLKNVMMFRVFNNLKSDYSWVLYERNQNGKQQPTQTVKVNLSDQADKLIFQLKSSRSNKKKLYQSKSLNNSSKIYESTQSFKTSQKGIQLKKQTVIPNSSSTNEINENRSTMKQMQSKFSKSLIEVSYLFCVGFSQNQIIQTIKNFHLQSKFSIINKTLKKTQQIIGPQIITHSPLNNLDLIEEQLQFSRQTFQKHSQVSNSLNETPQINLMPKNTEPDNFRLTQLPKNDQHTIYTNRDSKFIRQQNLVTPQTTELPLKISNLAQGVNETRQINLSQATNEQKTPLHQLDFVDFPQNNETNRDNNNLSKTEKTQQNIIFNLDLTQDRELVQTTPAHIIYDKNKSAINDKNPSKLALKSITYTDQSNLKLDDVILNGKRISVSDKSQWMITSKSKTSDNEKQSQSNPFHQINLRTQNQKKDIQSAKDLQINSRNQEELSLDLFSVNLKQKSPKNLDQLALQIGNTQKDDKRQDKYENMVKQNSILAIDNHFKLKRKSTAQDYSSNQNRIELSNKPKTMEESTIRKQLKTIKAQLRQGNWIDQNEQVYQGQQMSTPMFNNNNNSNQKFKNLIPSMIDENVQIGRSGSMSKSNSGQDPELFNTKLDDNYNWGQGLSQIRLQQAQSQGYLMEVKRRFRAFYLALLKCSSEFLRPIKEKWEQNAQSQRAQIFFTERFNLKYLLIIIVGMVLLSWFLSQFYPSSQNGFDRIGKNKKPKNRKQCNPIEKNSKKKMKREVNKNFP